METNQSLSEVSDGEEVHTMGGGQSWGSGLGVPWQYLSGFAKCMSTIIYYIYWSLTSFSMPIMLNKPFHLTMSWLFIMQFLHWKPFTKHGSVGPTIQNFSCSPLPFMLHAKRSMNTVLRWPNLLHTSCQWVRLFLLLSCTLDVSNLSLVLNLKEKMKYFKKHRLAELQEEVLKCVEEEVYLISLLSISGANCF